MATEFVFDESGKVKIDPETSLPLVKRGDEVIPLDVDKLFNGINESNRDAAAKRKSLETAKADLAARDDEIASLKAQLESAKGDPKGGGKQGEPKESETDRRIKALEDALAKERQEKERISQEQEQREIDRQIEAAFSESAYAAEHSHIPTDFWLARYRSHCGLENVNGGRCLVIKDENGNIIMSEKNPGLPAKLDEGLSLLCASRLRPGDIKLNPAPYGGSGTQQSYKSGSFSNPWKKDSWNVTEQHKIMAEDYPMAQRLAASAGAHLPPPTN